MLSENFDKKVKDAADQYSPPFEERSWDEMQLLLNKHLPEEKRDRRPIIMFLILAFLLGGGTFFLIDKMITSEKPIAKQQELNNKNVNSVTNSVLAPLGTVSEPQKTTISFPVNNSGITKSSFTNKSNANSGNQQQVVLFRITQPGIVSLSQQKSDDVNVNSDQSVMQSTQTNTVASNVENKTEIKQQDQTETNKTESLPIQPKKKSSSILSKLSFSASVGPDVSMVGVDNVGKFQLAYGAGISYQFSPKLSVRTGFYSARKIYSAAPDDYDPPKDFWQWYPNLKTIDANCKVYEIPLLVDYSFGKKKEWFVSGGMSSVIMKSEKYTYTFRPQYAQYDVKYTRTHKNENQHLFSMLNVSGGYTYQLNKTIALRAEPYVKIPVSGIGYGKIKLNSGGILMSVSVSPFK